MKHSHANNPYQRERNRAGLTQEQAIEFLPFSLRSLQSYEAGVRQPRFDAVRAMAKLYGCSTDAFTRTPAERASAGAGREKPHPPLRASAPARSENIKAGAGTEKPRPPLHASAPARSESIKAEAGTEKPRPSLRACAHTPAEKPARNT